MYARILAAVDGSRGARLALDEVLKIAKASGAEIVALFVVEHAPQLVDVGALYVPELLDGGGLPCRIAGRHEQHRARRNAQESFRDAAEQ